LSIVYYSTDPNWHHSFGEKIGFQHFRNGHYHAECDPMMGNCSVHYDEIDPHESLGSLIKHMWQSDLGKLVLVGVGALLLTKLLDNSKAGDC